MEIMATRIGPRHMPKLWDTTDFSLNLSRPFILAMEAELTWMNSREGKVEFEMPDFMKYIHFEPLESINPEKVKTLH